MTDPNEPTQPLNPLPPPFSTGSASYTWQAGATFDWRQWWKHPQQIWRSSGIVARLALIAVVPLVAIGCGIAGFASIAILQHALAKPDGYLWSDSTNIVFVQLTEDSNSHITGSWHSVSEESNQSITTEDSGFTGIANGSSVTLTFSALGFSSAISGILSGDTLTLQIPDRNGYIATDVFHGASIREFNNAVSQFRQLVSSHIAATAAAQATASAQAALDQAVTTANNQLASDLAGLANDTNALKGDSDFSDALSSYANDWAQMQTDYQQEQSDFQQGCGPDGENAVTVTNDAVTVNNDQMSIGNDDITLSNMVNSFNNDLSRLQQDITNAQSDWQNLQAAEAADTIGTALARFTANDVNTAITNAQNQMNASNKALTDAQSKASTFDKEAAQMNTNAQNLANSMNC